jgi:hypothetical protein
MHTRPLISQLSRRIAVLLTLLLAMTSAAVTESSAQSPAALSVANLHRPNLVVLGDSFAAGVGNEPYIAGTETTCKRSESAYGPQLDRWGLVDLQAFVACSGATTEQVWGPGRDGVVQIDSITADTDLVTIGALGNNFHFGDISALCILADCSRDKDLVPPDLGPPAGITVGQVLDSIPLLAPGQLDTLYQAIKGKLRPGAKVLVVEYAAPFPRTGSAVGPLCPYMTADELAVAQQFTDSLNTQLRIAAAKYGFRYVSTSTLFRGHDVCGFLPAFYQPGTVADQDGTLHPNQLGQTLYAVAVAKRLYF